MVLDCSYLAKRGVWHPTDVDPSVETGHVARSRIPLTPNSGREWHRVTQGGVPWQRSGWNTATKW